MTEIEKIQEALRVNQQQIDSMNASWGFGPGSLINLGINGLGAERGRLLTRLKELKAAE